MTRNQCTPWHRMNPYDNESMNYMTVYDIEWLHRMNLPCWWASRMTCHVISRDTENNCSMTPIGVNSERHKWGSGLCLVGAWCWVDSYRALDSRLQGMGFNFQCWTYAEVSGKLFIPCYLCLPGSHGYLMERAPSPPRIPSLCNDWLILQKMCWILSLRKWD